MNNSVPDKNYNFNFSLWIRRSLEHNNGEVLKPLYHSIIGEKYVVAPYCVLLVQVCNKMAYVVKETLWRAESTVLAQQFGPDKTQNTIIFKAHLNPYLVGGCDL